MYQTKGNLALKQSSIAEAYPYLRLVPKAATFYGESELQEQHQDLRAYKPFMATIICVIAVLSIVWGVMDTRAESRRNQIAQSVETQEVTVTRGDNLWSIASEHPVTGLSTQEVVNFIEKANSLSTAMLTPGQSLEVPC